MFKFLPAAAAAVALTFAAVPAAEAAVTFSGSVANVTANNSGSGLEVQTGLYNSFNFDLDVGENSGPIGLFTIWTNESDVAWGEDTSPRNIAVSSTSCSRTAPGRVARSKARPSDSTLSSAKAAR